ncbi:MAG: NosD domain-containing protein, partial [Candidatus Helarchaeota archaeon]
QAAINDAKNGDTIYVFDDSAPYYETVVIRKSINLIGEKKDSTIINGNENIPRSIVLITADWVNISGFTISNGGIDSKGIELFNANHNVISDNIICGTLKNGIFIESGAYNVICYNQIFNTNIGSGIILYRTSNNNTIENNSIHNTFNSIMLLGSEDHIVDSPSYNIIFGNQIYSNRYDGVSINDCSNHNIIQQNKIHNNNVGIYLIHFSQKNLIESNEISNNRMGLYIGYKENNIFHNNFIDNLHQSYDYEKNFWDNGIEGNYWSNFDEPSEGAVDEDCNGIVDKPFSIPGSINQDRYPLMYWYPDTSPPKVEITRPKNYLYICDNEIIPMDCPLILGRITVYLEATDASGIHHVEVFIDGDIKQSLFEYPYKWLFDERISGTHTIKATAYDKAGKPNITEINIRVFNI